MHFDRPNSPRHRPAKRRVVLGAPRQRRSVVNPAGRLGARLPVARAGAQGDVEPRAVP